MPDEPWRIDVSDDGDVLTVAASGELDISTSVDLIEAFAAVDRHSALVCDLNGVTFIDSTGIQALFALQADQPERFALGATSPTVERLLALTGLTEAFRRVSTR